MIETERDRFTHPYLPPANDTLIAISLEDDFLRSLWIWAGMSSGKDLSSNPFYSKTD
jgi:hypothetical protein